MIKREKGRFWNKGLIWVWIVAAGIIFCAGDLMAQNPKLEKTFTWKLQCAFPPPEKIVGKYWSTYGLSWEIARKVKVRTNGGLDIKVFPADALFKVMEAPEALKKGAIEMISSNGTYHVSIVPEAFLEFGLPYAAKSSDQINRLLYHRGYFNIFRQAYKDKHHAYLLGLASGGSYNYLTRFPIRGLADLKGKKIRASGTYGLIAKAQGAIPVSLSGAEQYMAPQRGTVDGTIYPPHTGISYKLFEVAKYQSWPPISAVMGANFLVNLDAWAGLPEAYQEILQAEVDTAVKYTFEISGPSLERLAREEGKQRFGAEPIYLSDEEFAKFREAVLPLWDDWSARGGYFTQLVKLARTP
jgi:TRAP-type C4-dicarboxylate transport system substrate-binding protein